MMTGYKGYRLLVMPGATGVFAGHDGDIATALKDSPSEVADWSFTTPADGFVAVVSESDPYTSPYWSPVAYRRESGAWVQYDKTGFTRKLHRRIATLSDEGEEGQRARLVPSDPAANLPTEYSWYGQWGDVLATPPPSPLVASTPDDPSLISMRFGVQAGATGDWAGHGGEIAYWAGDHWEFTSPDEGACYLFNFTPLDSRTIARTAATRSFVRQGSAWLPVGAIYQYHSGAWTLSDDQATPPDLVTGYGLAQAGDLVGPWLFNELWAGIKLLHRRVSRRVNSNRDGCQWGGAGSTYKQAGSTAPYPATWDQATASAEANWNAAPAPTPETRAFGGLGSSAPSAGNYGSFQALNPDTHGAGMQRNHTRERGFYQSLGFGMTMLTSLVNVDFYVIGAKPNYSSDDSFDDMGDPVANGTATKWNSQTGVTGGGQYDSDLWQPSETNTIPAPWCDEPTLTNYSMQRGYQVVYGFVVEENAVPGGFEYQ
jgi:hypothetical protein